MTASIQISDAEWEIMKVLWEEPGLTANEVTRRLASSKQWHAKTVRTMLTRLEKKGALEVTVADKLYCYRPLYSREDCIGAASRSFVARVFDGAFSPMMAHFVKTSPLSSKDREQLERILAKYKKGE